jgi:REP element-mobilizing transposase RayT
MARPLRIELAGGLYHVTSRGDRREDIYLCDDDRLAWLLVLAQVCERFNWRCHGWCQMTNHYHLVVETIEGNLSQGMRHLNGVYTQHVNRAHQRVGHVFQGRYKAVMIEKEGHLLELARYVVLNPVRAGMVSDAGQWRWSSYAAFVGLAAAPPWLEVDWVLGQFGVQRAQAVLRFVDFVRAGVGLPSVWEGLRGQIYLGSDAFVQRMQLLADQPLAEVPRMQRRPMALPLQDYVQGSTDRKAAMTAAYASGDYTLQAVADAFGVHYATVSRAVNGQ